MKNLTKLVCALLLTQFLACSTEKKEDKNSTKTEKETTAAYVLNEATNRSEEHTSELQSR